MWRDDAWGRRCHHHIWRDKVLRLDRVDTNVDSIDLEIALRVVL